jgi:hypothetical protein
MFICSVSFEIKARPNKDKSLLNEIIKRLWPLPAGLRVVMIFSFVAARSFLSGFERLNCKICVLLYSVSLQQNYLQKEKNKPIEKKGKIVGENTTPSASTSPRPLFGSLRPLWMVVSYSFALPQEY